MKDLFHFKDFVNEINKENGRLYKQTVLKKYKDDFVVKEFLKYAFDTSIMFGIGKAKLSKDLSYCHDAYSMSVFGLLEYLEVHNTGADYDVAHAQTVINRIAETDQEAADLLTSIVCKSLTLGIDSKSINKEMPGLIKTFSVQLANKYFEKPEKLAGKTFAITTKLDGFRLIAIKSATGDIKFYSRVGQPIEGLVEIEEEMRREIPNNIALDGELTISNYFDMPSKDAYKAASKIIRLKGDTPKRGLTFRVFDAMTADEFIAQKCDRTYDERRVLLDSFADRVELKHIDVLPVLYRGTDTTEITEWLDKITAAGGEGCMCNVCDAPYSWTRTWNLVKVKKFSSLDLLVVGLEEGEGRLSGTLGAIKVRYKDGSIVKVGSGFSDEERQLYWQNPDLILNKIVEIKYFEETTNADKTLSLRFPTWVANIRDPRDKAEADY